MISCTAPTVVCVAPDRDSLAALKRAAVGAEWELAPGATSSEQALRQIEEVAATAVVVFGGFADVVSATRQRWPWIHIVSIGPNPDSSVAVSSLDDVRAAIQSRNETGPPSQA